MTDALFDKFSEPTTASENRDEALERVESNASVEFLATAYGAVKRAAMIHETFIVDDVWQQLPDFAKTHEKRAMGAVVRRAVKEKIIEPTEEYRASQQPQCHGNPRRVWRSLIKGK